MNELRLNQKTFMDVSLLKTLSRKCKLNVKTNVFIMAA